MKVLWFTYTPSLYEGTKHLYHGCGWIESLERLVAQEVDIELAVAFFHPQDSQKTRKGRTTYYPILKKEGRKQPLKQLIDNWFGNLIDDDHYSTFKTIVDDFEPDIIHVFGTEGPFAKIQEATTIPVVTHLQGLINPCLNTYFPAGTSKMDFWTSRAFSTKNILGNSPTFAFKRFAKQAERERGILERSRNVMGRTQWDNRIAKLYNPKVNYFHVSEVLRSGFYDPERQEKDSSNPFTIVSTLSPTIYKGVDVVLRTAKLLKSFGRVDFRWRIAGLTDDDPLLRHYEKKEGICHKEVGIHCEGRLPEKDLIKLLQTSDVFVHPTYIDNSPNSVCEAQMLGLPVIATDVGGVASLIKHDETGLLVPSNGVFEIVHYLHALVDNGNLGQRIGKNAAELSNDRHDIGTIIGNLKGIYRAIIEHKQ